MRTCSCFRVTTLLPLLSLALTADGGVHEILEEAACLHHPLSLTNVCGSDQLVLRRLTLARAGIIEGIADCAVDIEMDMFKTNNTALLARLCCRLKPGDCTVPTDLPSQNRSVLKEFAGFVDKCRAGGASQCDLTHVTKQGTVPLSDVGTNCGLLSYVSVGYSCVRSEDVVSFGGADFNQTFPNGNVTLISDKNAHVTSAQCLLYSSVCDVTVGVGVLDADPQASCSLELSDGSRTANFSCSSPQLYNSWNRTFFISTSNHVTITVNLSSPSPRALWLTAEVLPGGGPLTVLCGQAASSVSLPVCPTTTSTSMIATCCTPSAGVVLTSSTAPSTTAALPSTAPLAVGWMAFDVTEKVFCKFLDLILDDSCDDPDSLALRAITLGRSADSSCAAATRLDLLDSSVRDKCCRRRPDDMNFTYHLPSDRDYLPSPYKELVERCFQRPDHCDLYGIPGVNSGKIPDGNVPNLGRLTYVVVSYSCIPKDATLSFTEDRTVTAPVVSLRLDENTPVSAQCLIYSHSCDVTIKLGIIDVNVHDPCTLTWDDGSPVWESCSRLQTQPQPLLQSSSNAVAVSLHFNGSGVDRQRLWLEAEGSEKSPITVVCGASAPTPASVRCTPATTSSTTAVSANTAGTSGETSTNVHRGITAVATEQTTHAVDWTTFNVTEKVVCVHSPLTLSDVCDDSHSLALRAITLGRSADFSCAAATRLDLLDSSVREKCCRLRPDDTYVTYHLPSDRDNLPSPYKELVEKCFQTPDHCDLYGIPGVIFGQIPEGFIPNHGPLTYVAVSYSCIPKDATLSFTEDRPVTAPVVSLRLDENTPVSALCLIYSHSCDVTIRLGIIDVNVHDPCTLTLDDRNAGAESCSRLQTQPQPLLQSSSNAVAVSLHFSGSGVDRQRLWLEAEGSDRSSITVACGPSAPAPASVRCTPAVPNTASTRPLHADTSAGTTRETSTNVHSGTTTVAVEQTIHADSSTPGAMIGGIIGGITALVVIVVIVIVIVRKRRGRREKRQTDDHYSGLHLDTRAAPRDQSMYDQLQGHRNPAGPHSADPDYLHPSAQDQEGTVYHDLDSITPQQAVPEYLDMVPTTQDQANPYYSGLHPATRVNSPEPAPYERLGMRQNMTSARPPSGTGTDRNYANASQPDSATRPDPQNPYYNAARQSEQP